MIASPRPGSVRFATFCVALAVGACSTSNDAPGVGTPPAPAAGEIPGPAGAPPVAGDPDGGGPAGPALRPTRVVAGDVRAVAVTEDGHAVYLDRMEDTLKVVALREGQPVTLATHVGDLGVDTGVVVSGSVIFVWTQLDARGAGRLRAWSATSGGAVELANASSFRHGAASSPDGKLAVFAGLVGSEGAPVLQVIGASVTREPSARGLVESADAGAECPAALAFAGARALVSTCDAEGAPRTLRVFDGAASWAGATLFEGGAWEDAHIALDAARARALVLGRPVDGADGFVAKVVQVAGGAAVTVGEAVESAMLSPDGATVVYARIGGGLFRVPSTGGAKTELVPEGGTRGGVLAVSRDFKWALASSAVVDVDYGVDAEGNPRTFSARDVFAVSLDKAGLRSPLLVEPNGAAGLADAPSSDGFTSDGASALYFVKIEGAARGTLVAQALGGGGRRELGARVRNARALTGSKVLWEHVVVEGDVSRTELVLGDVTGGAAQSLADAIEGPVILTALRDGVIYAASSEGKEGLYVADIP